MTPRRAPIGALKLREGLDGNGATCPPTAAGVFRTAASYGAEVSVRRATDRMPLAGASRLSTQRSLGTSRATVSLIFAAAAAGSVALAGLGIDSLVEIVAALFVRQQDDSAVRRRYILNLSTDAVCPVAEGSLGQFTRIVDHRRP